MQNKVQTRMRTTKKRKKKVNREIQLLTPRMDLMVVEEREVDGGRGRDGKRKHMGIFQNRVD